MTAVTISDEIAKYLARIKVTLLPARDHSASTGYLVGYPVAIRWLSGRLPGGYPVGYPVSYPVGYAKSNTIKSVSRKTLQPGAQAWRAGQPAPHAEQSKISTPRSSAPSCVCCSFSAVNKWVCSPAHKRGDGRSNRLRARRERKIPCSCRKCMRRQSAHGLVFRSAEICVVSILLTCKYFPNIQTK